VIPNFLNQGAGSILNASSWAALGTDRQHVACGAPKAAVNHITRHIANNWRWLIYREPVEGTPFGRYQLIELLGHGGMVQTESHRPVCATSTTTGSDSDTHRARSLGTVRAVRGQRRIRRNIYAHRRLAPGVGRCPAGIPRVVTPPRARECGVPVVPVALMGTADVLPKGGRYSPALLQVHIGEPVDPDGISAAQLREQVVALKESLQPAAVNRHALAA
jgi:hypothetical protein